tara:strand:+ start:118 stop:390 length:273 start_codon:yes stop_codon:yes gene_type:complete
MGNIAETTWFEEQLENMEQDFPFLNSKDPDKPEDILNDEDLPTVNPEFKDFDWDTPIKDQPWYTSSTNSFGGDTGVDADFVGEPEHLGDR